ncbi:MAG: serine/threonine protein kinase [Opitutus sp.]|nr:serine/threonine protein kinase [Opitutus sp.]
MKRIFSLFALAGVFCGEAFATDAHWAQFRGPGARGIAEGSKLPEHWSATENVAWKTDLPGRGWSSPIVWGNKIFLTAVVNLGESEAPKKGLYFGGERKEPPKSEHQWKVFCLDLATGKNLWEKTVRHGPPATSIHLKNSFASETPVTDGERVYVVFGNVGIFAFDLDGNEVWSRKLEPQPTRYGWGTAASPVLHGDRLYFVYDNDRQSELLALDKRTGRELWRVARDEKSNWATPFVWESGRRTEIITPGTGRVSSHDLDGNLLWSLRGMSTITIATPYTDGGLLYVSSGYVGDKSRPLYAIRPGASGDISLPPGETGSAFIAWSHPTAAPYNPSTVVYDGRLYVLHDRGLMSCYDAKTGEMRYDRERLLNGFAFTASPWIANGKIFCLNEDGVCYVVRAGDQFELLHTNKLLADDMCMATPAPVGDRLLIRTAARMYCLQTDAKP